MIPLGVIQTNGDGPVIPPKVVSIVVSAPTNNIVLRDLYDAQESEPPLPQDDITFTINNVDIGSTNTGFPSIDVGDWPVGVVPLLVNQSMTVFGKGSPGNVSQIRGGTAFRTTVPIRVDNSAGRFAGGGGGGRSSSQVNSSVTGLAYRKGGGGGAGNGPGDGGIGIQNGTTDGGDSSGDPGTATTGGNAGTFHSDPNQPSLFAGDGGDIAEQGGSSDLGPGGPPGYSVSGYSLIDWIDEGILSGPTTG